MPEMLTPKDAPELFAFYRHHMPGAPDGIQFRVTKLGMQMMLNEYERLALVEKAYEELKADRKIGRPLGRPPKELANG